MDKNGKPYYIAGVSHAICEQVWKDICAWLGMKNLREFLCALEARGTAIFPPEAGEAIHGSC